MTSRDSPVDGIRPADPADRPNEAPASAGSFVGIFVAFFGILIIGVLIAVSGR